MTMTFQMIKFSMIHLAPYQTKFTVTGFTFIENEIPLLRYFREICGKSDAAFGGCGFFGGCAPPKRVIPGSVRDLW